MDKLTVVLTDESMNQLIFHWPEQTSGLFVRKAYSTCNLQNCLVFIYGCFEVNLNLISGSQ